jgi:peptidoglycan/LPS O-acetylase OafA/YrhL
MNWLKREELSSPAKPYFDNLDLLRAIAAFAVLFFHLGRDIQAFFEQYAFFPEFKYLTKITDKGALGVNFFFVLSGFLITYLMFWELKSSGGFSYKKFLIRRTLRIWPLYFLIVALGFFIFPIIFDSYTTKHNVTWYLLFLSNFDEIRVGAFDSINFLTSPWSIAVEEQFYVVWGLLGLLFFSLIKPNKAYLKYALYLLICVSFVFRWMYWEDGRVLYYHTLSVMPDLLFGCLLAVYWDKNRVFFDRIKQVQKVTIRLVYALGILMILFKNVIFTENLVVFERYAIACFFCFVIVDQIQNERKISCAWLHKRLLFLGKISYGIYMYHLVVMYLLYDYVLSGLDYKGLNHFQLMLYAALYVVLAPSLTIIVSHVSFTLFEKPFLRLKSRF